MLFRLLLVLISTCYLVSAATSCPQNWTIEQTEAPQNKANDIVYLVTCAQKWYTYLFSPCTSWRITGRFYATRYNTIREAWEMYCECMTENCELYSILASYRCTTSNICDLTHFNRTIGSLVYLPKKENLDKAQNFGQNFRVHYIENTRLRHGRSGWSRFFNKNK